MQLRVLVACEMSGRVRDAFAARGWEAWSADLLPSEIKPVRTYTRDPDVWHHFGAAGRGFHYQGDCRDLFDWRHQLNTQRWKDCRGPLYELPLWDLVIAHPPCDHTSYAGARWFKVKQADGRQQRGIRFFGEMLAAPSPLVAVENPHSIVQATYGKAQQVVQPYWFGDPYAKGIHLWLKGLPHLKPTNLVAATGRVTTGGGNWRTDQAAGRLATSRFEDGEGRSRRAIVRSRTTEGLAAAMAAQWGAYAEEERERELGG